MRMIIYLSNSTKVSTNTETAMLVGENDDFSITLMPVYLYPAVFIIHHVKLELVSDWYNQFGQMVQP